MSAALGPLALLEELLLDSNPISEISPAPENHFVSLRRLSLSGTGLSTWHDIDCLLTFPSFVQLRLTNIPLFSGKGASEIRPEVIGRLSNLQLFNGSAVSVKERIDSEKSYLRKILRQKSNLESGGTYITELGIVYDQEILGNHFFQNIIHPKYNELNEKYGEELASYGTANQIGTGPQSIASDMITIRIKNLVFSCGNGMMEPVEKKIPGSLTVERLRLMIKQIYGIEPRAQNLSIRQDKNSMPTLMDDDSATLRYYGVIEGSDVFVNEAD
jgi:tubulin-specific chaperone E